MVPRTDLQFHKLRPTEENESQLIKISHNWILMAQERQKHSTDLKMKEIFESLTCNLNYFNHALRFADIGSQGREVYLSRNNSTKEIVSVAFGRELDAGDNICPHVICVNPDHIPHSLQSVNQSMLEGADSFLFRMIVKFGVHSGYTHIRFPTSENTIRGYKNIILQSSDASDIDTSRLGGLTMNLNELDFKIHGKHGSRDEFRDVFIKNLNE